MKQYSSIITILFFLLSFTVCFAENPQEWANFMENQTSELSCYTSEVTKEHAAELFSPEPSGVLEEIGILKPSAIPAETPEQLPTDNPLATLVPASTNIPFEIETPKPSAIPTKTPEPTPTSEPQVSLTPQPINIPNETETLKPSAAPMETPVSILEIISVADELTFLSVGESIYGIEFPKTTYIQTGPRDFLECEILWEDVSVIDTSVPGRTSLRGKLLPPQGYCFDKASEPYVEIPFLFFSPGGEPTEQAYPVENTTDTILIMPDTNLWDFISYDNKFPFKTSHGDIFYCKVEWDDFEAVHSEGPFSVNGRYLIPEGICLKEGVLPYYTQDFFVMKDDTIYLDFMKIQNGSIICTWLKEVEDSDDITTYYAIKNGGWQIDEDEQYGFVLSNGFIIHTTALSPDTDYYFKLEYQGHVTKTLHINIHEDQIKADFIEGDRDGGDNAEQEVPTLTQPKGSSSPSSTSQSPNPPSDGKTVITNPQPQPEEQSEFPNTSGYNYQTNKTDKTNILPSTLPENHPNENLLDTEERVSATQTVITGERLEQMAAVQGGNPAFEKGGIVLELPKGFTQKNSITNNDKISINIDKKADEIAVRVEINDNRISDITGAKICIPENDAVLKKDGKEISPVRKWDSGTVFPIDETGIYNTRDSSGSEDTRLPKKLWLGIGIFAICLFILLIRMVKHYRK